jgi:hypothetical protein
MAEYVMDTDGEYGKYITQTLQAPAMNEEFNTKYKLWAERLLWMDSDVVPGAFQMNTSWYNAAPDMRPLFRHEEHVHDFDEMIGFLGSDYTDPNNLGAVIEIGINGELHRLTKSSIIFIPAGLKHLPLTILEMERPVLHFSISLSPFYTSTRTEGKDDGETSLYSYN